MMTTSKITNSKIINKSSPVTDMRDAIADVLDLEETIGRNDGSTGFATRQVGQLIFEDVCARISGDRMYYGGNFIGTIEYEDHYDEKKAVVYDRNGNELTYQVYGPDCKMSEVHANLEGSIEDKFANKD